VFLKKDAKTLEAFETLSKFLLQNLEVSELCLIFADRNKNDSDMFDRQAKRLAKHYASFKQDYKDFLDELRKNPLAGIDLGGGVRKVRMAITSKGKVC